MSQPSRWDFKKSKKKKKGALIRWHARPPEPSRLADPAAHSQLPARRGTVLKPPITFLFEGTGLSVKFQYLSESMKQFESNTIWKTLGGSHYLRTCHREEISALNFRRNWSHLGLAGIIPPTALAEHITIWVLPSSLFTFFPLKRRTGRNPTLKVPDEAPPAVLYPWVAGAAPGKHDKTPASSRREVPSARVPGGRDESQTVKSHVRESSPGIGEESPAFAHLSPNQVPGRALARQRLTQRRVLRATVLERPVLGRNHWHVRLFATPRTVAHRVLCVWDLPGKNTGVVRRFLL